MWLGAWAYTIQYDCASREKRLPAYFTGIIKGSVCVRARVRVWPTMRAVASAANHELCNAMMWQMCDAAAAGA